MDEMLDFIMTIAVYVWSRYQSAWEYLVEGIKTGNSKWVCGGAFGLVYLTGVLAFVMLVFYKGYSQNTKLYVLISVGLFVAFILSNMK